MSTLALILARGGSKRLPGKNVKLLGNLPLIAWSINFAKDHPGIDNIVVSSDDPKIVQVARENGVDVPWLRPAELASDTATSVDTILHALKAEAMAGREYEQLVLLQPTSPFRDPAMLTEALEISRSNDGCPVVAVGAAKSHPLWCYKVTAEGTAVPYVSNDEGTVSRSQDLPLAYEITGNLYVVGVKSFLEEPGFLNARTRVVVSTNKILDCDIDDELDWELATSIAKKFHI
jgi:CMP-N-acetylneuraminic acid synthetase